MLKLLSNYNTYFWWIWRITSKIIIWLIMQPLECIIFSWFEIINMDESSNITIKFEVITNEYETWQTVVIAVIWIILQTIGNGLLLSLIHYYKFGGDPLKQRIVDNVSLSFSVEVPSSPSESLQISWNDFQNAQTSWARKRSWDENKLWLRGFLEYKQF